MLNSMRDVAKSSISHAFYTYAHINKQTNKIFYIGKGSKNRYKSTNRRSAHWNAIVNKYGFNAEILAHWNTEKEAFDHEMLLISCFKDMGYKLANLTDGGEGIVGLVFTEEHKRNIAKGGIGNKNMIGKHLSESQKQKLRDRNLNRKHTPETKYKISQAMKGKRSPEFAQKIKESWIKRRQKSIGL